MLSCAGLGLTSQIIAGIDWVRQNHVKRAVANMSLGGGVSTALNTATTNLWNAGVFVAVAVGNDNADACNTSPASATGVGVHDRGIPPRRTRRRRSPRGSSTTRWGT
ncbi:MAG: S8 family serine peptidase [Gemmatimonadales bacterium]